MAILRVRLAIIAILAITVFLLPVSAVFADDTQPLQLYEEKIKSGLIYNFLKYTDWPADKMTPGKTLRVCLVGSAPFDQYLYPLADRTAQQHAIKIKRIEPADAENCELVLIHRDRTANMAGLLEHLKGRAVLTVSDIDGFADAGGMVEFRTQDSHVGFIVNEKTVAAAGMRIGDRLLKLSWQDSGHVE